MAVRKRANSWQYDFKLPGYERQRRAGFKTKAEAHEAERRAREDLISGRKRVQFADAYEQYMSATTMKDRSRDSTGISGRRSNPCSDTSSSRRWTPRRWTRSSAPYPPGSDRNRSTTGSPWCEPF